MWEGDEIRTMILLKNALSSIRNFSKYRIGYTQFKNMWFNKIKGFSCFTACYLSSERSSCRMHCCFSVCQVEDSRCLNFSPISSEVFCGKQLQIEHLLSTNSVEYGISKDCKKQKSRIQRELGGYKFTNLRNLLFSYISLGKLSMRIIHFWIKMINSDEFSSVWILKKYGDKIICIVDLHIFSIVIDNYLLEFVILFIMTNWKYMQIIELLYQVIKDVAGKISLKVFMYYIAKKIYKWIKQMVGTHTFMVFLLLIRSFGRRTKNKLCRTI